MKRRMMLLIGCLLFIGCVKNKIGSNIEDKITIPKISKIKKEYFVDMKNANTMFMLYRKNFIVLYFDGNCSVCLSKFLELVAKSKNAENITVFYIAKTSDRVLIDYYMQKAGIKMHKNEHLIIDKTGAFERDNPGVNAQSLELFLTDRNFNVIEEGSVYQKNKIVDKYF